VTVDTGYSKIYASENGTLSRLLVSVGQTVKKGDVLLVVNVERRTVQGVVQKTVIDKLSERKQSLENTKSIQSEITHNRIKEIDNRINELKLQLAQNISRQNLIKERIRLAKAQVDRQINLVAEGFVSAASVDEKKALLIEVEDALAEVETKRIEISHTLKSVLAESVQIPIEAKNTEASLNRDIYLIESESAQQQGGLEFFVLAPQSGTVTSISARAGQTITPDTPLVDIVPENAKYSIELFAASKGIGFIAPMQKVSLRYEAFPYQKFGVQHGQVRQIAKTALPAKKIDLALDEKESYYRILVDIDNRGIFAYGKRMPLQVGMKVEADIQLDTRTIWEWVMEPLYGIKEKVRG
jgi:membrane fusion protein